MNSRIIKIIITAAVIAGGAGYLIMSSLKHSEYFQEVHELMAEPQKWEGKTLRIHGFVEAGSIDERIIDQKSVLTFVLQQEGKKIKVTHTGPKPDTFKELADVVARGRIVKLDGKYEFEANELVAKCPSKYEEKARQRATGQQERTVF